MKHIYLIWGLVIFSSFFIENNKAIAADSTSYGAVDVPWEEPTAKRARTADFATKAGNGVEDITSSTMTLSNGEELKIEGGGGAACETKSFSGSASKRLPSGWKCNSGNGNHYISPGNACGAGYTKVTLLSASYRQDRVGGYEYCRTYWSDLCQEQC